MARYLWPLLSAVVAAACSDTTDLDDRTLLVEFEHMPTVTDSQTLADRGGRVTLLVEAVQSLVIRTDRDAASFETVSGVTAVQDLGWDEDPVVSVFIHMVSEPTEADLEFVRQAGGTDVSASLSEPMIMAQMRISAVDGLLGYDRFTEINAYANNVQPM